MRKVVIGGASFCALFLALLMQSSNRMLVPHQEMEAPRTAFVHLFEWTWDDVGQECETVLGPNGFSAVQISPPNEHAVIPEAGFPWWQRYQPVSYQIESRSGDRTQFATMIARCHRAGVKIYADAVINHMSAQTEGVGSAGTVYQEYHYPGLYSPKDFHPCRQDIQDYGNRTDVLSCELVGLPDLDTGSESVQRTIAHYLADLVQLGVDGFRIDAAKHMDTHDLAAILARFRQSSQSDRTFVYQEVLDPGNEAIKKQEYYANGNVIEAEYGRLLGAAFLGINGQTLAQLETLGESWGLMPSEKAIVFVDNHDKQRGHGGGGTYLTYKDSSLYALANVFMLAFPYGYPQVMSSFAFSQSDQGPPADASGKTIPVYQQGKAQCFDQWVCEHRWQAIAQMVGFRNATQSVLAVTDWWSNGRNQIAFGRGDRGFVVINRETEPLTHQFQTQLAAGQYCNIIQTQLQSNGQGCDDTIQIVTVDRQGQFTVTVPPMEAIAIHVGAKVD